MYVRHPQINCMNPSTLLALVDDVRRWQVLRNISATFIMSRYLETPTQHVMPWLVQGPRQISCINRSPAQPLRSVE
jgi:hypothetical protein